ncbi:hypothetical protein LOTGIDRAFT_238796 [Lottia gigantea]|uniref:N-acetylglucosamine-1-phosphotransferase subunits alpha/beta n=1 Tax=Lottia gigantea TaxID=225164 RepID=V4AQQ8_LOTGI|nr:hypothetical protein LOTGIDRAFT_238796 [Lottia gigantea]ESO99577.1 hypothetical protein LOTGIDRAFT_238796 [Lottia gigantea]
MVSRIRKLIQKRVYDILSHKNGTLIVFIGLIIIIVSAFHFGEAVIEWSHEKYATVFNSYSDNIGSKSFRKRLCLPVPIDVVYTWVNGTDPALLKQLSQLRYELKEEITSTQETKCTFHNCVPSNLVVLDPVLNEEISLLKLQTMNKLFLEANKIFNVHTPNEPKRNFTFVQFNEQIVDNFTSKYVILDGKNTSVSKVFYTSDLTKQYSMVSEDIILMTGFPHTLTSTELKQKLPEKYQPSISDIKLHIDIGVAVLTVPDKIQFNFILELQNCSIDGKTPTFSTANYIWELRDFSRGEDIASSRFEDNEELRYSMRSLMRFAPWVHHIFIVTNGQIPYWLNMDNPQVTVVTHEELFPNKSHLPTFSSPAIEAHIHRIPGLSDRFIYMNDDVMFGKEVWPDDFYSQSAGHKVYLTWPVPNCNDGCPSNWIKDGYCDKACNNTECDWDGGDCDGKSGVQLGAGFHAGYDTASFGKYYFHFGSSLKGQMLHFAAYCNTGCANTWIADRYCDTACNVKVCGFDAGDCGVEQYGDLYGIMLSKDINTYHIPVGITEAYFNLTEVFSINGTITQALYNINSVIRQVAVSNKYHVLTIVLLGKFNQTWLNFSLHGHTGEKENTFSTNFTVSVDTSKDLKQEKTVTSNKTMNESDTEEEEDIVILPALTEKERKPQIKMGKEDMLNFMDRDFNSNNTQLPTEIISQLYLLETEYKADELTAKGFRKQLQKLKSSLLSPSDVKLNKVLRRLLWLDNEDFEDLNSQWYLNKSQSVDNHIGLPWEVKNIMKDIKIVSEDNDYGTPTHHGRRLLDTFGDSLRHVNKIYNKAFGFDSRKVPAHMPHMIDKNIMAELQARFPEEWDVTSSHKIRHPKDMQFAFSFYYYVMGVKDEVNSSQVFEEIDTDHSGVLSDREIRTLAARLYDLPLYLELLTGLENLFLNCSKSIAPETQDESVTELYYDKNMPQVTKYILLNCEDFTSLIKEKFKPVGRYKYTITEEDEIAFKMIKTNVSSVVGQLDDVRKNPKKFICINDNIEHGSEEAKTVKAILQDFYESMFPIQSDFELPRDYRNRFLNIKELKEWKSYRDWLRFWTHIALVLLVIITIATYFGDKIEEKYKEYKKHSKLKRKNSNSSLLFNDSPDLDNTQSIINV